LSVLTQGAAPQRLQSTTPWSPIPYYSAGQNIDYTDTTWWGVQPTSVSAPEVVGQVNGRIVFVSDVDGDSEIYLADNLAVGGTPTKLTNNAIEDTNPVFSPDGTQIAFQSGQPGNSSIYTINADGSGVPSLMANNAAEPVWSPDGTRIVFIRGGAIYMVYADGTNEQMIQGITGAAHPVWSPDGRWLTYENGAGEIYLVSARCRTNCNPASLTENITQAVRGSAWSPDGKQMALGILNESNQYDLYLANVGYIKTSSGPPIPSSLTLVAVGNPLISGLDVNSPSWTPQGDRIAFEANAEVYQAPVAGGQREALIVGAFAPTWSQTVACIGLNPTEFQTLYLLTETNPDRQIRKACLMQYYGILMSAVFHESNNNAGISFNELPQFTQQNNINDPYISTFSTLDEEYNHRHLYTVAALNGIVNKARKGQNPMRYFGDNFECTVRLLECIDIDGDGLEVFDTNPQWLRGTWTGTDCNLFLKSGNDLDYCADYTWYNYLVKMLAYQLDKSTWNTAYTQILPEILAAIHDEVFTDAPIVDYIANNDILQGGISAKDANICPDVNKETKLCNTLPVTDPFITMVADGETISAAYMRHLDRVYKASAECITPIIGPNGIADGYLPRATNGYPVLGYTSRAYIRFGLSGDSIHIFYFHTGEMKWKTAVFQLGNVKVLDVIPDGIIWTSQPADPASWLPDPSIKFELLMPLGVVRPKPKC